MRDFYQQLEPFPDFRQLSDPTRFQLAPPDWFVVVADIQGSTQAIRDGRYKEVNLVGAAPITAVLNSCPGIELPHVFGGMARHC